jgi:hypothetical protein
VHSTAQQRLQKKRWALASSAKRALSLQLPEECINRFFQLETRHASICPTRSSGRGVFVFFFSCCCCCCCLFLFLLCLVRAERFGTAALLRVFSAVSACVWCWWAWILLCILPL